jgi:polyphosphate kinase
MAKEYTFINRDLSWLSFNHRVLLEAADESVPLYSRIHFLSIFSSNLDEFFRVRMPSIYAFSSINAKKTSLREEYPENLSQTVIDYVLGSLRISEEYLQNKFYPLSKKTIFIFITAIT